MKVVRVEQGRNVALLVSSTLLVAVLMVVLILSIGLYFPNDRIIENEEYCQVEAELLLNTLTGAVGLVASSCNKANIAANPAVLVDIAVQFKAPPSVALRLVQEKNVPYKRVLPRGTHEEEALLAHKEFFENIRKIPKPFDISKIEVLSEHHRLFNGVFLRVPNSKVEKIARVPGVFAVFVDGGATVDAYIIDADAVDALATADFFHNKEARILFGIEYINNNLGYTGKGIRVAILDTGVDYNHPCLLRYQDPATGRIRGTNFVDGDPNNIMDYHWHGTHVTGTIVAMAPDVQIYHHRVIGNDGRGSWRNVLQGLEEAHSQNVDIINISLRQGAVLSAPINLAALDGIVVVVGAGNSGVSYSTINPCSVAELPIFVANGVIGGIGGTNDTIHTTSSRGPTPELSYRKIAAYKICPDITAPGTQIYSTGLNSNYRSATGTSMAAPAVSGVAALMLNAFPNAAPYEVKARLMNTAKPLIDLPERDDSVFTVGAGFVRPLEALQSTSFVVIPAEIPIHSLSSTQTISVDAYLSSFSFLSLDDDMFNGNSRTLTATIYNNSREDRTYTIGHTFTRNHNDAVILTLSRRTITVPAGGTNYFAATMSVKGNVSGGACVDGFYEGHVYIRNITDDSLVLKIPFALVNHRTRNMPANKLDFNLGGTCESPTYPDIINPISVKQGKYIQRFINNDHYGFTHKYGGFPQQGLIREGFTFLGWYLDSNFTKPLNDRLSMVASPVTLYARWE